MYMFLLLFEQINDDYDDDDDDDQGRPQADILDACASKRNF